MKSLYSILGVAPDATSDQIEAAYAGILAKFKEGAAGATGEGASIKLVAAKEAYAVLSDPVARKRYDIKLKETSAAGPLAASARQVTYDAGEPGGIGKYLVIGGILLAGLAFYSYQAREREQMRIQHEREIQLKALQLAEERQKQMEAEQEWRLERQREFDAERREQTEKREHERYMREFEDRRRQNLREEEQRAQREKYEKQRQEREEEMKRQQELRTAQMRAAKDKRDLQQLEYERYGRVLTR